MSETQIIKPLTPTVKVSSMDNHRMLTHPAAAPARAGTQLPRRTGGGGQPIKHQQNDVAFRAAPMEAVMGGGGVIVKHPKPLRPMTLSPAMAEAPAVAPVGRSTETVLTPDQAAFCAAVLDEHMNRRALAGELATPSGKASLELAQGAMLVFVQIAGDRAIDATVKAHEIERAAADPKTAG